MILGWPWPTLCNAFIWDKSWNVHICITVSDLYTIFVLSWVEYEKSFITSRPDSYVTSIISCLMYLCFDRMNVELCFYKYFVINRFMHDAHMYFSVSWIQIMHVHVLTPGRLCTRYEPQHDISNNVVCATSKCSDQPVHTRRLIRAFSSRLNIIL